MEMTSSGGSAFVAEVSRPWYNILLYDTLHYDLLMSNYIYIPYIIIFFIALVMLVLKVRKKMNKKLVIPPIVLGLLITLYAGLISSTTPSKLNLGGATEGSAWIVCVNNKDCETFHNVITNQYLNESIAHAFMGGDSAANFSYMALGNGTVPAAASTSLNAEITDCGLARALGTASWVGTGNASITKTWTSTCNNLVVNTTMLLNASSSGTTYGGGEFTDRTLQTNDNITVTAYTWWTSS